MVFFCQNRKLFKIKLKTKVSSWIYWFSFKVMEESNISLSSPKSIVCCGGFIVCIIVFWKIFRYYRSIVLIPVLSSRHNYNMLDVMSHAAYCNICEDMIVEGVYCDKCGICADKGCIAKADANISCKKSTSKVGEKFLCHWIRGNLHMHSICCVCKEEIEDEAALKDYRCCWCQRTVHESGACFEAVKKQECDFGKWAPCIIPPFAIKVKHVWFKGKRHLIVDSLNKFDPKTNWSPLVVVANRKSGSNDAEKTLRAFRFVLNPTQVVDLSENRLECALEWCLLLKKHHQDIKVRILVAGGDGTVGWVLDTIDRLKLDPKPVVAILPLGTGNDLARVLGWGSHFSPETQMDDLMEKIQKSNVAKLDRWKITLSTLRPFKIPMRVKSVYMNNYFSVGVDALVALNFHQTRETKVYRIFGNRFLNKLLYFGYGTKDVLERKCSLLNEKIILEIDGVRIDLPKLESILVLNIPSWGGGADIWKSGQSGDAVAEQRINDQRLEVLGLYSSFHIGQLMIGLSEPLRFGQGRQVTIHLLDELPIQIDGEPTLQSPTKVEISWFNQTDVLITSESML